jgi:hypothetical protein
LREAVVELACDPPPLVDNSRLRECPLVEMDHPHSTDEEHNVPEQTERISGVDPLGIQRRKDEVVDAGDGRNG